MGFVVSMQALALTLLLAAGCWSAVVSAANSRCDALLGGSGVTVLMSADPGDFSGSAEIKYYLENLKGEKKVANGTSVCPHVSTGTIMGQKVAIATSGIGPVSAALCVSDFLQCGARVKEIIYMGTSGWSAKLGGVVTPPACDKPNTGKPILRIGDVCVSPFTLNWECKKADWNQQCGGFPNVCYRPQEVFGPNATFLFGDCVFSSVTSASLSLTKELLAAARSDSASSAAPRRNAAVLKWEKNFFGVISKSTKESYQRQLDPAAPPTVYSHHTCAEVDGQFFYAGVPWEITARDYVALLINKALGTKKTATDVIAVSAMEAIGVAHAVERHNTLSSTQKPVTYTFVRAMSNWLHQPPVKTARGQWRYGERLEEDIPNGYGYGIATGSNAVLSLLRARCLKAAGNKATKLCKYTISYK